MSTLPVRVMVQDAWDQVNLDLPASATVSELKQRALALTHQVGKAEEYEVKFRGAAVLDEGRSLSETGVVPNAALIVLPRRRRPVR
ncbi:MAG TPA: hypothetical protein VG692_06150 [Gemmatimonadales bacterium]|nr:hypothetical protein [Gemmatimonadales bacterium]